MHGQHALVAVVEHRAGRSVPGELHVALVAQHRHVMVATPRGHRSEVIESAGRIARGVHPQGQGPGSVSRVDARHVEPPTVVKGHRHRSTAGQDGPHLIGRVGHLRVEHRVAFGGTEAQKVGQAGHQLLGADTGADGRRVDGHPVATVHPGGHGVKQGRAAHRRRVGTGRVGDSQRPGDDVGHRVAGRADRKVDGTAGQGVGDGPQAGHRVVGHGRGHESGHGAHSRPSGWSLSIRNPARRPADPASRRARTRQPSSSADSSSTSPSRWTMASTSPRS